MDNSCDKQTKSRTKRLEYGYGKETLRQKLNLFKLQLKTTLYYNENK